MTQQLATRNADSVQLDFGLNLNFDQTHGMRAEGRADSPGYIGAWYPGTAQADVTITTVADNYSIPSPSPAAPWSALWVGKAAIPPNQFPVIVQGAGVNYGRIADDPNGAFVRDTVLAPSSRLIDPNDIGIAPDDQPGVFRWIITFLKATNATDGQPLLSAQGEENIAGIWPNK